MAAVERGPVLKLFWRLHKWILQLTGGRNMDKIGNLSVLLLRTVGRKSGKPRLTALSYVPHENGYVVVASNAGADFDPAWWLNLQAMPDAEIEIRGVKTKVKWHTATVAEAAGLYKQFVDAETGYSDYKQRTQREIPVVVLKPVS